MAGRASFAGSSSNLLSRSRPTSVHEKKQNVPTAVAGGSLHIPSNFARGDWALAVAVNKPSKTRMTGVDCCFRRLIESDDSSMELFGARRRVAHEPSFGVSDHPVGGAAAAGGTRGQPPRGCPFPRPRHGHLLRERVWADLEFEDFASGTFSAFDVEWSASRKGRPDAFPFPTSARIVNPAVDSLCVETH